MRLEPDGFFHLTYCTNIHPADGWPAVFDNIRRTAPVLKTRLSPNSPFGLGLRLSAREARELLEGDRLADFKSFLDREGLYVAIINGFPYGAFHGAPVKAKVYAPDWRDDARVEYTLELFEILRRLVPPDVDGGVSTAPLSYKPWMTGASDEEWAAITTNVTRVAETLARIRMAGGPVLHLDIEPEPDCLLENTTETIEFFERWLFQRGATELATRLGITVEAARDAIREHIRICFDCCHFAVEFENPVAALDRFHAAGIRIGRVQLSSALRVAPASGALASADVAARLQPFVESTYLHQVVARQSGGLSHFPDLDVALQSAAATPTDAEWRIHFHVPLFTDRYDNLDSTQNVVRETLQAAWLSRFTRHLEIETYTWDVLPAALKIDVADSITREYRWVPRRSMHKTAVLNVVGLTPALIGANTPHLSAWAARGRQAIITPAFPAVTCTAQADYLTGVYPDQHGVVGNGWYFRDDCEVRFWRQSNKLVQAPKIWDTARAADPAFTCANLFWWFNMYSTADYSVTPRPIYRADGAKWPDIYTTPASLRSELQSKLGTFPLFDFWGPRTSIRSSQWIADAAVQVDQQYNSTLTLVYLPHLDYNLQRLGPSNPAVAGDLREIDGVCGRLIEYFESRGARVIVLSEYGLVDVKRPIHLNRFLRGHGLLAVREELGGELLDAGASAAFAVADHQVAHVYVNDASKASTVRSLLEKVAGVERVLDKSQQAAHKLAHDRSGDFVVIAEPDAWFTYYYWLDDERAPDFARTVDIHRKPGYDPAELLIDPAITMPALQVGWKLAKKQLGFRYLMDVIPLDATLVKGSHGRPSVGDDHGPLLITQHPDLLSGDLGARGLQTPGLKTRGSIDRLRSVDVAGTILRHLQPQDS